MRALVAGWSNPTVILVSVFVAACDGGSGSGGFSGVSPDSPPLTGTFVDATVEGIEYQTLNDDLRIPGLSGTTDGNGTYRYQSGELITFLIGGIVIGSARAQAIMTPADLVPTLQVVDTQARLDYLLNLIRLLQTLDEDGDPGNGIIIPQIARDTVPPAEIVFSISAADFASDLGVQTYVGLVTQPSGSVLIDAASASAHFDQSVAALVEEKGYEDPRLSWGLVEVVP